MSLGRVLVLLLAGSSLPRVSLASCIPPHSLPVKHSSGALRLEKEFRFDGSVDIVQEVNDFVQELGVDLKFHVGVLEALLRHAVAFSAARDIDNGELFMRLDGTEDGGQKKISAAAEAIELLANKSLASRVWTVASSPPFQIVLHNDEEYMSQQIMSPSSYWLYDQIKALTAGATLSKGSNGVVIDVGANLGMVSLFAAAAGEEAVAFEATSGSAQRLKASCMINGWCPSARDASTANSFSTNRKFAIFENAVSSTDGEDVSLRINWLTTGNLENSGANSMFAVAENGDASSCEIENVQSVTLDSALASLGLLPPASVSKAEEGDFTPRKHISLLKLDCEGCEPSALLGAARLFKLNPPLSMMVEVNVERLEAGGSSALEFLKNFERLGYDVVNSESGTMMSPVTEEDLAAAIGDGDAIFDILALLQSFNWKLGE